VDCLAVRAQKGFTGVQWQVSAGPWAVGGYTGPGKTLALRWNGSRWKKAATPNPGASNGSTLLGVTALSSSDAWAVGAYTGSNLVGNTLVLHWNGSGWTQIASPTPPGGAQLNSVSALSRSRAWAVGYTDTGTTLILRWNGRSWTRS
jgi:hypothetical protein